MGTATTRTKADLLSRFAALFLDNQTGDVTPDKALDEFLDAIKSSMDCYFTLGSNSPTAPMTPSLTTSYAVVNNYPVTAGSGVTISAAAGTVTIPSGSEGDWMLGFACAISPTSNVIAVDGAIHNAGTVTSIYSTGAGQTQAGSVQYWFTNFMSQRVITLAAGAVLDFRLKATGATATQSWIDVWGRRVG